MACGNVSRLSALRRPACTVALFAVLGAARPPSATGLLDLSDKHRRVGLVATSARLLGGPLFDRSGALWFLAVTNGYIPRARPTSCRREPCRRRNRRVAVDARAPTPGG